MTAINELTLSDRDFKAVQSLIYDLAGIAIADAKHVMVQSRLAKRVRKLELESYSDYLWYLSRPENKDEIVNFTNALTTNKTDFFREKHHFDFLTNTAFPAVKQRAENGGERRLRIWCSASSTGEEPYTIAMSVREFFGDDPSWDIRILASDIDTEVLAKASEGVYDPDRFYEVESHLVKKYFHRQLRGDDSPLQAKSTLRDLITFRRINLQDQAWPINASFDIIFCRNVMIYFDRPSQKKVVEHFAGHLSPDGYLIIGHSEALFGITDQYKSIGDTIYVLAASQSGNIKAKRFNSGQPPTQKEAEINLVTIPAITPAAPKAERPKAFPLKTNELTLDHSAGDPKIPIIVGEVYSSAEPVWITTLLGSCVAVCLYDDVAKVGGMNHFMLPIPSDKSVNSASYGVHSMELLINSVMKSGGDRRRLKAKVFGGGNVLQAGSNKARIGSSNVDFALKFLNTENIPVIANFSERDSGMHVKFHTHTNKVNIRMLDRRTAAEIQHKDSMQARVVQKALTQSTDVTLF